MNRGRDALPCRRCVPPALAGRDYVGVRPGSDIVFLREERGLAGGQAWNRTFFCEPWPAPPQTQTRALLLAARTLNAIGQSRVTLSLQ